jgi:hypothetical protein
VARTLDFADHRRDLGSNRYVYAVVSRRARGLSIGINLDTDKACNFDCPYCQVDRSVPGYAGPVDLDRLAAELEGFLGWVADGSLWSRPPFDSTAPEIRRVADIAFAGDGEPTARPIFAAAAARVKSARDAISPGVPIRLLTNSTMLHLERVQAGLVHIDEPWCKLDAGTPEVFRFVDRTSIPFERVLTNLRETAARRPIVVQSMFFRYAEPGHFLEHGPSDHEVQQWGLRLGEIASGGTLSRVQVYTVARAPADPRVAALERAKLEEIAAAVPARVEVEVHG